MGIHSLQLHYRQYLVALLFADLPSLSPFFILVCYYSNIAHASNGPECMMAYVNASLAPVTALEPSGGDSNIAPRVFTRTRRRVHENGGSVEAQEPH